MVTLAANFTADHIQAAGYDYPDAAEDFRSADFPSIFFVDAK